MKIHPPYVGDLQLGTRVLITDGAWKGYSGEYAQVEKTPIGDLHRVQLDNGMATLVSLDSMKVIEE
jgi:hypothetical protein